MTTSFRTQHSPISWASLLLWELTVASTSGTLFRWPHLRTMALALNLYFRKTLVGDSQTVSSHAHAFGLKCTVIEKCCLGSCFKEEIGINSVNITVNFRAQGKLMATGDPDTMAVELAE